MKRTTALLVAAAMTTASLTGCGGNAGNGGDESTNPEVKSSGGSSSDEMVFAWWGNQTRNERTQQVIDLYMEENPGVSIDGQPSQFADYWNKLATAAAGNALPDVIQMDYKYLDQYVENGLLLDLTPYVDNGILDVSDCNQDVIDSGKVDGQFYAVCIGISSPALVYSKTVAEQAGVEIKNNMNIEEFLDTCRKIYETTGYKTNIAYTDNEPFMEYLLRAKDVTLFEDGKMGGEAADYVEYFELYETGLKEEWPIDPAVFVERTKTTELNPLVYGTSPENMSWCTFHLTNQYSVLVGSAAEGNELGMVTWPSDNVKKSNYLKPSQFLAVSKDAKNPEEAVKFVNWFNNSVECNNILLAERGIPVSKSVSEAVSEKLPEPDQEAIAFVNEIVSPNSSKVNPPADAGASGVIDLLNQLEEQVCYGQITAQEAGTRLFEEGNQMMAK